MIAKPCDIAAARKAGRIRPKLDRNLGLTVSIFCAGTPSTGGTVELLRRLGTTPDQISSLRYRGQGWPGMTGVDLKTGGGGRLEMTYEEAWGGILTGHKPLRCLMCPDGTGEFADIACGDPWYRRVEDGEKGTSLIVVRTEMGREILGRAMEAGYIVAEARKVEVLTGSQEGLLNRRRHVWAKLAMLRLLGLPRPRFEGFSLWRGWLHLGTRRKLVSLYRALRLAIGLRGCRPVRHGAEEIEEAFEISRPRQSGEAVAERTAMKQVPSH